MVRWAFPLSDLLPDGQGLVAVLKAYLDESGTHEDALVTAVGGYVFDATSVPYLDIEWPEILHGFGLKTFHMTDFVARKKPYDSMSEGERKELLTRLVKAIKKRKRVGLVGSLSMSDFNDLAPEAWRIDPLSAYTIAGVRCLRGIGEWAKTSRKLSEGSIAYVFHSGARHRSELDKAIGKLISNPRHLALLRYAGHGFSTELIPSLQAADLWVWEYVWHFKDTKLMKRPSRESLKALIGKNTRSHLVEHFSRDALKRFFAEYPEP